jgi:hypothetical protein
VLALKEERLTNGHKEERIIVVECRNMGKKGNKNINNKIRKQSK